jgi:cell volume regulation protein A
MHSEAVMLAQQFLTLLFFIFLIGTIGGKVAEKVGIPDVVVYILLGMALGMYDVVSVGADSMLNQIVLLFGASFILFHGGMITSLPVLKDVWRTITMLSTFGVVCTAFIVAVATMMMFDIPFLVALLLGSVLASTDPAALVPIFRKFPVKRRVSQTVITESAFTDATGAIMTTVVFGLLMSDAHVSWESISRQFIQLSLGGALVGGIVGLVAAFLISGHKSGILREFTPMVIVLAVLSTYLIAESVQTSGFMGVFVAGLMVGNARLFKLNVLPTERKAAHHFMDTLGLKLRMIIFVLLGSQVDFSVVKQYGAQGLWVVLVFIMIARPLTVLFSLLTDSKAGWTQAEVLFFCWTRETGVIAAALMGIIASAGIPEGELLSSIAFMAILVTLLLQASTTPLVAKKLKLLE